MQKCPTFYPQKQPNVLYYNTGDSPFGVTLKDREFTSEKYRYSLNGQEKVDEISGKGNHTTAMYWEYETRLGRRWNIDPVIKPFESVYATFNNAPLWIIDIQGNKGDKTTENTPKKEGLVSSRLTGSKNVYVLILDQDQTFEEVGKNLIPEGWDYIASYDLSGARDAAQDYYKTKTDVIESLIIRTHGNKAGVLSTKDGHQLNPYTNVNGPMSYFRDLLTDDANIVLTGCNTAHSEKAAKNLANFFLEENPKRKIALNAAATASVNSGSWFGTHPKFDQWLVAKTKGGGYYGGFRVYYYDEGKQKTVALQSFYDIMVNSEGGFTLKHMPINFSIDLGEKKIKP